MPVILLLRLMRLMFLALWLAVLPSLPGAPLRGPSRPLPDGSNGADPPSNLIMVFKLRITLLLKSPVTLLARASITL